MSIKITVAGLALACAGLFGTAASAAPVSPTNATPVGAERLQVETVQYRYHGKRRYCWYWDGWHGPGWYWCGYHRRKGYGWGGGSGWNKWSHPPRVYHKPAPRPHRYVPKKHYGPPKKVYKRVY